MLAKFGANLLLTGVKVAEMPCPTKTPSWLYLDCLNEDLECPETLLIGFVGVFSRILFVLDFFMKALETFEVFALLVLALLDRLLLIDLVCLCFVGVSVRFILPCDIFRDWID